MLQEDKSLDVFDFCPLINIACLKGMIEKNICPDKFLFNPSQILCQTASATSNQDIKLLSVDELIDCHEVRRKVFCTQIQGYDGTISRLGFVYAQNGYIVTTQKNSHNICIHIAAPMCRSVLYTETRSQVYKNCDGA